MMENGQELMRGNEERIYVSVRLRPLNSKEISRNDVSDWECINDKTIVFKNVGILASERFMYQSAYAFDRVFRSDCSTREVYEQGAKNVAISVVSGINSSVFAYGQTSSGKTYTMTGITEYAIADIYDYMQKHPERDFILKFSALEIYNESVRDLLSEDGTQLRLLDDPERGTIVEKLTEEIVRDRDHVIQLLSICAAQRQIGETSLNETSSRSHQIIRLTIESSSREFLVKDNASTLTATVNFVDLAGSERASQSLSAGTRLKEGCHVNRSLLTLGTVIRKLSKGQNGHIPYRDSKLTRILQTSLGGNARTAIICTMSPARTHVEQSRNTLLFASCAKEVTTNAQVNVVMSDKVLIKHLQKELARLESEIRNPGSTYVPPNYYAILREKNIQIEELEKEIKDLILQRDVALLQVNDLLRMLGNDASSTMQVAHYPHLRVQKSPDAIIQRPETSESPDPRSLTVDPRACSDRHSRTISDDFSSKAPSFDENFVNINATPRILFSSSSSSSSSSESCHGWAQIDTLSITTSEDLCRDVRCIEPAEANSIQFIEANYLFYEPNVESNQELISSHLKNDNEVAKLDNLHEMMVMDEKQSKSPTFVKMEKDIFSEEKELISNTEKESRSVDLSLRHHRDEDLFGNRNLKLVRSKSCQARITTGPDSPYLNMMEYSEKTPSVGSEKEYSEGFVREIYPSNVGSSSIEPLSRNNTQSPPKNDLDLEINAPDVTCLNGEDGSSSSLHMSEKDDHPNDKELNENPVSQISESNESEKKNVDRVEDNEIRGLSSWPVEFKKLQREIIELWHACNIALVQRTYFFLHFQGDPTDAIYLEVEIRKMRFLKDKYSRGEKTVLNGKRLTLASSAKILRQERRTLSEQMMKKFTEQERESLFVKWGISLKSKFRRLQLANLLWTNNEDMNHIEESAYLVAKLVGFIEPGQVPNKDMFGLNFAPQSSNTGISSYKRSLVSIF